MISRSVRAVANRVAEICGTEVISTEELKFHIEKANKAIHDRVNKSTCYRPRRANCLPQMQNLNDVCVLSMDVSALYPSISRDLAFRSIVKTIKKHKVKYDNYIVIF